MDLLWLTALAVCGLFTLILGSAHFFFPALLDFGQAIPREGLPLRPFRLGPIHYPTERQDVYGIAWVMNHAASYTLVSVGVADYWLCVGWERRLVSVCRSGSRVGGSCAPAANSISDGDGRLVDLGRICPAGPDPHRGRIPMIGNDRAQAVT